MNAFSIRLERFRSELKWLFCELYPENGSEFELLIEKMQQAYKTRSASLRERDSLFMNNPAWYRMASMQEKFAKSEANVAEMAIEETPDTAEKFFKTVDRLFAFSAEDLDLLKVSGIEGIFIIPNTIWQHRQKTHDFTRIFRIVDDIVCPSILLSLEAKSTREEINAFFGEIEKPEFHIIDDRFFIPALWNSVATQDTRLLSEEIRQRSQQPKFCVYTRSLNCEDGFTWELDYAFLDILKMQKESHCKYLNDFYTKRRKGEKTRAKALKDEAGEIIGIQGETEKLIRGDESLNELLHAVLFIQSGIPLLEEKTGKKNAKAEKDPFEKLLKFRRSYHAFDSNADVWTMDTDNNAILGVGRYKEGQKVYGFFNFSPDPQVFTVRDPGTYENLLTGKAVKVSGLVRLPAYGYAWLFRENG